MKVAEPALEALYFLGKGLSAACPVSQEGLFVSCVSYSQGVGMLKWRESVGYVPWQGALLVKAWAKLDA